MKVLIVAAHPDDEVLGIGGTLLKHVAAGDAVSICMVTKATHPQWTKKYMADKVKEQAKFDAFMGVQKRFNLDLPTAQLNTIAHGALNRQITEVVERVGPDVVYTHSSTDLNKDHSLIFHGCMVAVRPPRRVRLLCFETLSETEWNNEPFIPNTWIDIAPYIDKKIEALSIYRSEVKSPPHPRSSEGVRILARKRGMEICVEYAEAFVLIRDVR